MSVDSAIFWVFAALSVTAALGAVLSRSIINAALCLIVVFMSISAFFLLNNADFLAIAQIIIYAVGLTIIMLFAIMFTGDKPLPKASSHPLARVAYLLVLAYVGALLIKTMAGVFSIQMTHPPSAVTIQTLAEQGSTGLLGNLLFKNYALPFEIASVLLLAAMIGAIVIAKKRFVEAGSLEGDTHFEIDSESAPSPEALEALRKRRQVEREAREADQNKLVATGAAEGGE